MKKYFVLLLTFLCFIITGCNTNIKPNQNVDLLNFYIPNDYKVRRLTPKECERLQGFPDNWTQYGKDDEQISDTQRYKCCGNAVTTNVITAIVNEMFNNKQIWWFKMEWL